MYVNNNSAIMSSIKYENDSTKVENKIYEISDEDSSDSEVTLKTHTFIPRSSAFGAKIIYQAFNDEYDDTKPGSSLVQHKIEIIDEPCPTSSIDTKVIYGLSSKYEYSDNAKGSNFMFNAGRSSEGCSGGSDSYGANMNTVKVPVILENVNTENTFSCQICHEVFAQNHLLVQHMYLQHPCKRTYICDSCDLTYSYLHNFLRHKAICSQLKAESQLNNNLRPSPNYLPQSHYNGTAVDSRRRYVRKPYACGMCSESFGVSSRLEYHMCLHGPTVCKICGTILHNFKKLLEHSKTHKQIKLNICPVCNKALGAVASLHRHVISVHCKYHECVICNESFTQDLLLNMHMKDHFGETTECPVCKINFKITVMGRHLNTHVST